MKIPKSCELWGRNGPVFFVMKKGRRLTLATIHHDPNAKSFTPEALAKHFRNKRYKKVGEFVKHDSR